MKKICFTSQTSFMETVDKARKAHLPRVLCDLRCQLERDSYRGWRIPGQGGLIIWQRNDGLWGWTHFSTGEYGDTISFLTKYYGMKFKEAVEILSGHNRPEHSIEKPGPIRNKFSPIRTAPQRILRITAPPPKMWQKKALELIEQAEEKLHSDKNLKVWNWLHQRGLNDETIRNSRVGCLLNDSYDSCDSWGLPTELKIDGKLRKLFLPAGLLIPIFDSEQNVMRLWVRRFSEEGRKYHIVKGSSMITFILGRIGRPVVICETDLDAWLIYQEKRQIST